MRRLAVGHQVEGITGGLMVKEAAKDKK